MKVVWDLNQATFRDVYEKLLEHRRIAYTTVMTMMKILEEKGHLKKNQDDRAFVYVPAQPRQAVISGMVREFVNLAFDGSAEPLLMHLAANEKLSDADLAEISRLVKANRGRSHDPRFLVQL